MVCIVGFESVSYSASIADINKTLKEVGTRKVDTGIQVRDIEFQVKDHGESKPISPNPKPDGSDHPEGRAANRRVEIVIKD